MFDQENSTTINSAVINEKKVLSKEQIEALGITVCRLQYDQTSIVFEKLSYLLLNDSGKDYRENWKCVAAAAKIRAVKSEIDFAWKECWGHMGECEGKHPRMIEGYENMEAVAITAFKSGHIIYFMSAGTNEFMTQSRRDAELNHPKLSGHLRSAAYTLDEAVDELS